MANPYTVKLYMVMQPCGEKHPPGCSHVCGTVIDVKLTRDAAERVQKKHPGSIIEKSIATK